MSNSQLCCLPDVLNGLNHLKMNSVYVLVIKQKERKTGWRKKKTLLVCFCRYGTIIAQLNWRMRVAREFLISVPRLSVAVSTFGYTTQKSQRPTSHL